MGGIQLDGTTGNINFSNAGSITWGNNSPVKYQFATSSSGPWHDTMATTDKYRRDSLDGGITWGDPYQFKGTDGSNGSDANVTFDNIKAALQKANGIQQSFITVNEAGFPIIYGGEIYGANFYGNTFNIFPSEAGSGAFNLYGWISAGGTMYNMVQISYDPGTLQVIFTSPANSSASWTFPSTSFDNDVQFYGTVDLTKATVKGLTAVFG